MHAFITSLSIHFSFSFLIITASTIAIFISLDKIHSFFWDYRFPFFGAFFDKLKYLILSNRITEAIAICEQLSSHPSIYVFREAILRFHLPDSLIRNGVAITVEEMKKKIRYKIYFIQFISIFVISVSILFFSFLLGQSFYDYKTGTVSWEIMRGDIVDHFFVLLFGLCLSFLSFFSYYFLSYKAQILIEELELSSFKILDLIQQKKMNSYLEGNGFDSDIQKQAA